MAQPNPFVPNALFPDQSDPFAAAAPTPADAYTQNANAYQSWLARERASGVASGMLDPQTGWPTGNALVDAARQYGGAMIAGTGAPMGGRIPANMAESLASRFKISYKPPVVEPRPFMADYPGGAPSDGSGTLTHTMDGQPITAHYVVGRRAVGEPDTPLTPGGVDAISASVLGAVPRPVAAREIGGDAGRFRPGADPVTGDPSFHVLFAKGLKQGIRDDTIAHEVGHGIDYLAKYIDQSDPKIRTELAKVYHEMNAQGAGASAPQSTPQNLFGYTDAQAPRELMAEALRAYMQSPNYLKSAAPETAGAIRNAVNKNPMFNRWIQFNSAAGLMAGGAAAASGGQPDPTQ